MKVGLKKICILVALTLMTASCTAIKHVRKTRKISADRAIEECPQPKEYYFIPATSYGVEIRLMRHKNCMGIPDMVMSMWFGERDEINELTAKLLALLYIQSENSRTKVQRARIFLKVDSATTVPQRPGPHIMFFELIKINPEDYKNGGDN